MDLSIVAAVGSFVVSERVLKPKATVLVILGFVLAYDLTRKTQDVASLRVYRGPSLVALTLMMFAYSLRKWRRNGVACDELIFLPGTQHGHRIGIEGPLVESIFNGENSDAETNNSMYAPIPPLESKAMLGTDETGRNLELTSLSSTEKERNTVEKIDRVDSLSTHNSDEGDCSDEDDEMALLDTNETVHAVDADSSDRNTPDRVETGSTDETGTNTGIRACLRQWVERYPHLAQLWTLFFNRSGGSNNSNATYAPSGPAVFGAALDLGVPVLFNFHVFILTFNHIQRPDYKGSDFSAKILPIAFLAVLFARVVIPPARRLRFWGTMKFTFAAPYFRVCVRDEYIGDCLTSWVRIGQDLVFATIYFFVVIWGTLSGRYSLMESGEILAESWCLHNIILPLVAILPLWLKFLQTLRQAYDANQRWPYLGNAFKYLSAALVIIYGTTHPNQRRSLAWIACFIFAMFYQVFWDIVMDWQLFEVPPDISVVIPGTASSIESASISSVRPSSHLLLSLQMYVVQPLKYCCQRLTAQISTLRNIQLRQQRLYKTEFFYWTILVYNIFTRFTWMCCFIPAYHVSRSQTVVLTSTSDVTSYWGVLLPAAELFRRTLWGFLYLEKETIKMMNADSKYRQVGLCGDCRDEDAESGGSDERTINSKVHKNRNDLMPTWLGKQQQVAHEAATTRARRHSQLCRSLFLFELCVWAAGFVILGFVATR